VFSSNLDGFQVVAGNKRARVSSQNGIPGPQPRRPVGRPRNVEIAGLDPTQGRLSLGQNLRTDTPASSGQNTSDQTIESPIDDTNMDYTPPEQVNV
jgi:hypothetical protein